METPINATEVLFEIKRIELCYDDEIDKVNTLLSSGAVLLFISKHTTNDTNNETICYHLGFR